MLLRSPAMEDSETEQSTFSCGFSVLEVLLGSKFVGLAVDELSTKGHMNRPQHELLQFRGMLRYMMVGCW